jgi:hypothetical protein
MSAFMMGGGNQLLIKLNCGFTCATKGTSYKCMGGIIPN